VKRLRDRVATEVVARVRTPRITPKAQAGASGTAMQAIDRATPMRRTPELMQLLTIVTCRLRYSTVTDFARFLGWSTSVPFRIAQ
jgi:hypothetical protein